MAHTRSESTCRTPAIQERLRERDRMLDASSLHWLHRARAELNRARRAPFPSEAVEAE